MRLINNSKHGDCSTCPAKNVAVRKRGKVLQCISCCKRDDTQKQLQRQIDKQKVRGLISYQEESGIVDDVQILIAELDSVVSRYVRLSAMGKDMKCDCFTCGVRQKWTVMQAGHYISRANLSVRFDTTNNIRVQCVGCNVGKHGNIVVYSERLEAQNKGIVEYLEEQARVVSRPTRDELKSLLIDFRAKLKIVENAKLK